MDDGFILRDMRLHTEGGRKLFGDVLASHGLRYEPDMEYAPGAFTAQDELIACGACAGATLKVFAIVEQARRHNISGALIFKLSRWEFERGVTHLFVYTRPQNKIFFLNSGFYVLAETPDAVLLENRPTGIEDYFQDMTSSQPSDRLYGSVVMNCNPFTLDHRYLIESAASRSDVVYIFLVREDLSEFPFEVMKRLLRDGTADIPNVKIYDGGPYFISSATFPTYFLKKEADAASISAELNLTLFARRIGPFFSISRRFVGEEAYWPVTRKYNEIMSRVLPDNGISVTMISRLRKNGDAVSASRVRGILRRDGVHSSLLALLPEATWNYLHNDESRQAIDSIGKSQSTM